MQMYSLYVNTWFSAYKHSHGHLDTRVLHCKFGGRTITVLQLTTEPQFIPTTITITVTVLAFHNIIAGLSLPHKLNGF